MNVAIDKRTLGIHQRLADADSRWSAVVNRDPRFDGQFVYGVLTTGIYCRPTCPSRLAKPENVSFYSTCGNAEKAGFRPCLRCKPNNETSMMEVHAGVITEACRKIEESEDLPALDSLANDFRLSPSHFHRMFKAFTGITPRAYGVAYRAQRLRNALSDGTGRVTDAIYCAGFNSNSRFYEMSHDMLGMTPTAFRDGGANATIMFAVSKSCLGSIVVARSARGLCAVLMGDCSKQLIEDLQSSFPRANLVCSTPRFERLVTKVIGSVNIPAAGQHLPLQIRRTAFQSRVWVTLRRFAPTWDMIGI